MEKFEIFITCISWRSGQKKRPVLVLLINDGCILVYPITTQYENKSKAIRARYYKMTDWMQSGLDKQSYIDTGTLLKLPLSVIANKKPIGKLTLAEKQKLLKFLNKSNF